jgi:chitodextrinase
MAATLAAPTGPGPFDNRIKAAEDVYAEPRDPWLWPFSQDSIWNTPIGSDAEYVSGGHFPGQGYIHADDEIHLKAKASDPIRTIYSPGSWTQRCAGTTPGEFESEMHFPDGIVIPDAITTGGVYETPNNVAAILKPDGRTLVQLEPLCRTDPTGPVYGYQYPRNEDIQGQGINGTHWGSGLSGIGGSIRTGELTGDEPLKHAIKLNVWGKYLYYDTVTNKGYRWPADRNDNAAPNTYHGTDSNVQMGSLMALLPDVSPEDLGITTKPGLKLFHALQDYGAYIADDTGWDAYGFSLSYEARYEFAEHYGYSFNQGAGGSGEAGEYYDDLTTLIENLHVIGNNSESNIGGGGDRRAPLASPDFIPMDAEPPGVPANPEIAGRTTNSVTLTWQSSADNTRVMKYDVYTNGIRVGSTYGATTFTASGLNRNTLYTFSVRAVDTNLNESAPSIERSARTYDGYEIDFNNNAASKWALTNAGLEYGKLKLSNWSGRASAVYGDRIFSPGTASYRFTSNIYTIANDNNGKTKLLFNYQDDNNTYEVEFGGGTANTVKLNKIVNGTATMLAVYTGTGNDPAPFPVRNATTVAVTYEHGGYISVSASPSGGSSTKLFDRIQDTAFSSGKIGVASLYTESFVDNVRVEIEGTNDTPDTTKPSVPESLEAPVVTTTTATLKWQPSLDDIGIKEYIVYQDDVEIGRETDTLYKISGLERMRSYTFEVSAIDEAGNESDRSVAIAITTPEVDSFKEYETDFGSAAGAENWLLGNHGAAADGQLKLENWGGVSHAIYDGDVYSGDLTFSADVSGWGTAESNIIKLLFYYRNENNYYSVEGGSGGVALKKRVNGSEDTLATYSDYNIKDGARLTISYSNGAISVTGSKGGMETTLFEEVQDDSLTSGRIGTGIAYNVAFFDNVSVTAVLTDAYPPAAPTALRATSVGSETIDLAWDASTDNVGIDGYEIKIDGVNRGWTEETSIHLDGLEGGTSYSATVVAMDLSGNRSASSNAITIVTKPSTKLSRDGWSGTASSTEPGGSAANALDGLSSTRWSSGQPMTAGQWYTIDLGSEQSFNRIVIDSGSSSGDYMRGYQISVSDDGESWSSAIAEGSGSVLTDIHFDTVTARYVRIDQRGESGSWWSIHEIHLHLLAAEAGGEETGGEETGGEETGGEETGGEETGGQDGGHHEGSDAGNGEESDSVVLTADVITATDETVEVTWKEGQTRLEIPLSLVGILTGKELVVHAEGLSLTITDDLLRESQTKGSGEKMSLFLSMNRLKEQNRIRPKVPFGNAVYAGEGYDLSLTLQAEDGRVTTIQTFNVPVELRFSINESKPAVMPVIYYIHEDGTLQYMPTRYNKGEAIANVSHFSLYAPLVFQPNHQEHSLHNHWAYSAMSRVTAFLLDYAQQNIIMPMDEPSAHMTRGAFAAYVSRTLALPERGGEALFSDAVNHAYAKDINALAEAGAVNGIGEGLFAPDEPITRQAAVAMMMRAVRAAAPEAELAIAPDSFRFEDEQEIDEWAVADIRLAHRMGLLKGQPGSLLSPQAALSMAEAAELVIRASRLVHNVK